MGRQTGRCGMNGRSTSTPTTTQLLPQAMALRPTPSGSWCQAAAKTLRPERRNRVSSTTSRTSVPVTVRVPGWAQNPTTRAQKTSKVGAVKHPRKRSSRLQTERGRLRVSIGGDLWFGDRVREPPMLACSLARKQLSQSRHRYQPKTAKLQQKTSSCLCGQERYATLATT